MDRSGAALENDDVQRHSDRPTIPATVDESSLGHGGSRAIVDASLLNGETVRARASDFRALLEAERRIADTARSGVRAIAPEVAAQKAGEPLRIPVPKRLARTAEASRVEPPAQEEAPAAHAFADASTPANEPPSSERLAFPSPAQVDPAPAPADGVVSLAAEAPRTRARAHGTARRVIAGLLFAVVMAGALGLLGVALSRKGLLNLPQVSAIRR